MRGGDAMYSEIQLTIEEMGCSVLPGAEPSKIEHQNRLEHRHSKELISGAAGKPVLRLPVADIIMCDRLI